MVLWSSSVFSTSPPPSPALSLISRFGSFNSQGQLIISGLAYNYAFAVYFIKTPDATVSPPPLTPPPLSLVSLPIHRRDSPPAPSFAIIFLRSRAVAFVFRFIFSSIIIMRGMTPPSKLIFVKINYIFVKILCVSSHQKVKIFHIYPLCIVFSRLLYYNLIRLFLYLVILILTIINPLE